MTSLLDFAVNLLWFAIGFFSILAAGVAGALVAILYGRAGR